MSPEALLVEPYIPVAQVVAYEILYHAAGSRNVIVLVGAHYRVDEGVETAYQPPVEKGPACVGHLGGSRVEPVDVGIQREHGIRVVQGSEELAAHFLHPGLVELQVVPGLGVGKHIPAQRVGTVAVEGLERVDGVAEALAHLLALPVEHESVGYHPPESGSAAHHGMYRVQGIEPAARLVDALGDEVGRTAEIGSVLAPETGLRIRHGTGIEPYVYQVRFAGHLLPGRAYEEYLVDIGTVQVYPAVVLLAHVVGVEALVPQRIRFHESGRHGLVYLGIQLLQRADAQLLASVFGTPYGKRRAPVAAAAEVPVLDVLEPLSEPAGSCGLGLPDYLVVEPYHLVAHGGSPYEPAVERIVDHRLVGAPAVRIAVHMLLYLEGLALLLEHHAQVDVERGSVGGKGIVVGVLHIPSGPLAVGGVDPFPDIVRVEVFDTAEAALVVHLGLGVAVRVNDGQGGNSGIPGHLGVVGTESGSDVHDAGTFLCRDIVSEDYPERAFVRTEPRYQLFVAHALEFRALHDAGQHLVGRLAGEHALHKILGNYICAFLAAVRIGGTHLHIIDTGPYAEGGIGRECPGSGRPCEEIQPVNACDLELRYAGSVLDIAVAARLVELVAAESGTCGRRIRLYGLALVEQPLRVYLLQEPPERLDVAVVVGDVGVVHVDPIADALGKGTPLGRIFHHLLAAGAVVVLDAYLPSYVFLGDAELLLHSQLDGQSVGVPSRAAAHLVSGLGLVAAYRILYGAGHYMVNARHAVGGRRPLEEDELRRALPKPERGSESILLLPLFKDVPCRPYQIKSAVLFESHTFFVILRLPDFRRNTISQS